ncbi:MAG: hypothetical protein LBU34_05425, partial [Planctomycetaceae bacterium]|nr:hypothetical protein [Planctomycetaceae bacterium]
MPAKIERSLTKNWLLIVRISLALDLLADTSNSGNSNFVPNSSVGVAVLETYSHAEQSAAINKILPEEAVQAIFKKYHCDFGGTFWNSQNVFMIYLYQNIRGVSCSAAIAFFLSTFLKDQEK